MSGIKPTKLYLAKTKKTKNGESRYGWGFSICGQMNFSNLAALLKIPTKRKQRTLIKALESYARPTDAILLNEDFRVRLFNKALLKYKILPKLSKFLTSKLSFDVSTGALNDWKNGRYHCPISVVLKLADLCNYPREHVIANTLTYKSHKMEKPFIPQAELLNDLFNSCNKV